MRGFVFVAFAVFSFSAFAQMPDVHPEIWPEVPRVVQRDAALEKRVDDLLKRMTIEQKVGQVIQPSITTITPADVRTYGFGSVLNGGGGWPGDVRKAAPKDWLALADAYQWWLLRHAQAALYPSVVEGFGLVPFEAAAVGTPCLVAPGTAPAELLGGTGAPVAEWSAAAWADRLAELITDPGARAALVAEIDAVADGLTWERCAHRTWDAIDHALAAPRRARHAEDGGPLTRVAGRPAAARGARWARSSRDR